jgi:predicted Rossmann-fold nucleotide-binding protein
MCKNHFLSDVNISEMKSICVFCGSKEPKTSALMDSADTLAQEMVKRGYSLVYGGGNVGIMGVLASRVIAGNIKILFSCNS